MRIDLRLHGRTADGRKCYADVTVHASTKARFMEEAKKAGEHGPWIAADGRHEFIEDDSQITVEHVERLPPKPPPRRPKDKKRRKK
jgi:hypothetical protein